MMIIVVVTANSGGTFCRVCSGKRCARALLVATLTPACNGTWTLSQAGRVCVWHGPLPPGPPFLLVPPPFGPPSPKRPINSRWVLNVL